MNGSIAQIVALACHANASIRGARIGAFLRSNSTCQHCEQVNFVANEDAERCHKILLAESPEAWFELLRSTFARGIRLSHMPSTDPEYDDRFTAGFVGGGGTWSIEVLRSEEVMESWQDQWEHFPDATDGRVWRVTYTRSAGGLAAPIDGDVCSATTALTKAIREVHAFSVSNRLEWFASRFAEALDTLASNGSRLRGYHTDLAPPESITMPARTLLDACQQAWFFGGMGSWNDVFIEHESEDVDDYDRVSENLYRCLVQAILVGTNQGFPD